MNCIICNQEIENDSQFINDNWYHNKCIENLQQENKQLQITVNNCKQENERLNNIINELHKVLNKEINNLQNAKVESKEYVKCRTLCDILNKLSDLIGELKESGNNE